MQIGELARRLDVDYRTVRYALERRHADRWVARAGGSGHYRDLTHGEAFALALLLKLHEAGLSMPNAQRVVELVEEGVRTVARAFGWDPAFAPFKGDLTTSHQWFAEVGDSTAFRMATDANPSRAGDMEVFEWITLGRRRKELPGFRPCVTVRIDVAQLAALVGT